jgi:predicted enzyme related to lactoylglutathione lyase/uncharacterized protein YndB with AHSA1/START domain
MRFTMLILFCFVLPAQAGEPIGGEMTTQSIDTGLFAAETETRSFVITGTIAAPVDAVYAAWSNGVAFAQAYGPDRPELKANIDLAIGGRYEWLWDGKLGSNDCQVLSFIPGRMISFSWNAPPDQAESRAMRTWVVVDFEATADGGTDITLTHLGFGTAPHWNETYDYFEAAWPTVLATLKKNLEISPTHHVHHGINYIEFTVTDMAECKRFYGTAFDWEFNDYGPDYAGIQKEGSEAGGLRLDSVTPIAAPLVILYSKNLDLTLAKVREAGGRITKEPFDFPGGRRFQFEDPSGNELAVWSER